MNVCVSGFETNVFVKLEKKKKKWGKRGEKLTCARNYNLSVGKIIFV